jgi:DNA-binding phage protein
MFLQVYEFDAAEYLTDEAAIAAYLESARAGSDAAAIEDAEAVAARARLRLADATRGD